MIEDKSDKKNHKKIILAMILIFLVFTCAITSASFVIGGRYATKNIQVLYISQAELLAIEKARIANESLADMQLFFGKPEKAIKYIQQAQRKMNKKGVLVLLSDSKIYGSNVRSISKEVHEEVIKSLAKEKG